MISWDISPQLQIETDASKTSEVEVRFVAEASDRTRVEVEHRHLERHGDGWEGIRDSVGSEVADRAACGGSPSDSRPDGYTVRVPRT